MLARHGYAEAMAEAAMEARAARAARAAAVAARAASRIRRGRWQGHRTGLPAPAAAHAATGVGRAAHRPRGSTSSAPARRSDGSDATGELHLEAPSDFTGTRESTGRSIRRRSLRKYPVGRIYAKVQSHLGPLPH